MMHVCKDQSAHCTRNVTIHQQLWQNTLKENLYEPIYLTICYLQRTGQLQSGIILWITNTISCEILFFFYRGEPIFVHCVAQQIHEFKNSTKQNIIY